MTRKRSFTKNWDYLVQVVFDCVVVPDVLLMMELKFSPSSWKVWKPKFLERSEFGTYTKTHSDSKRKITFKITYNKKSKLWSYSETPSTE